MDYSLSERLDYLNEKRIELINDYYYWMSTLNDEDELEEVLSEIENEIVLIEQEIDILEAY